MQFSKDTKSSKAPKATKSKMDRQLAGGHKNETGSHAPKFTKASKTPKSSKMQKSSKSIKVTKQ
jgi:hypothetical protein